MQPMGHVVNPILRRVLGSLVITVVALLWIVTDGIGGGVSDRDGLVIVTELLVLAIIGFRAQTAMEMIWRRRRQGRRGTTVSFGQRVVSAAGFAVMLRIGAYFLVRALSGRGILLSDTPPAFRPLLVFAIVAYFGWPELEAGFRRWRTL